MTFHARPTVSDLARSLREIFYIPFGHFAIPLGTPPVFTPSGLENSTTSDLKAGMTLDIIHIFDIPPPRTQTTDGVGFASYDWKS